MTDALPGGARFWRRHPIRWGLGALLFLAALATLWRGLRPEGVQTVSLETRDVRRTLVLVGRVRPPSRVALGATLPGTVRQMRVREGDRVARGDGLVLLDDREARALLAQAQASLAEVSATVRAAIEQAETEVAQSERDLERVRSVFREGARTQQQVEQAEQRAADARSRLEAAQANATDAGNASVSRAQAAVEAAAARRALTRIDAPADGVVLSRAVESGDVVQPGQTLLEIATDGPTEIVVFPSEENLAQLRLGAPASASADAYPDSIFAAAISLIAPRVDPDQGTVEVRLSLADPPPYLIADMTLSVNIETGRRDDARVLEADAIRGLGTAEPWVAVIRAGRLQRQAVTVGLRSDSFVEILDGVGPEDEIVPPDGSPDLGARVRTRSVR